MESHILCYESFILSLNLNHPQIASAVALITSHTLFVVVRVTGLVVVAAFDPSLAKHFLRKDDLFLH